jgi:hypothetical protein
MFSRHAAALLIAASTLLGSAELAAAPTAKERAEAKTLWTKGKRLYAQEKWIEAVEAFRAAAELAPTAQYELDLARALAEAGELVEAKQLAESVQQTKEANAQMAKNAAKKLADGLAPRIPTLEIQLSGPAAAGATVTLNGDEVQPGTALPLDPGDYLVKATATDGAEAKRKVDLLEGQRQRVELVLEAARPVQATTTTEDEDGGGTMLPAAIAFGVGGAGIVLGSVFGILGFHETAAVTEVCGGTTCPPDRAADVDRVQMYGTVSNVAFAVGGLGIATGIVLAFTVGADDDAPEGDAAWVKPYVGAGEVGVVGRF